jgi:hypothetical protein
LLILFIIFDIWIDGSVEIMHIFSLC